MVFGASSAGQFKCSAKRGTQYFGDDVSMLLCGSRKPQLVHYSVKTTEVTQLKVLPGKVLVDILTKTPSFNLHHRQIKRYGCWLLLKASLIRHVRDRAARDAVWKSTTGLGGPHQTSELSISANSKSIRLIFGRIDCSHRVLEARHKAFRRNRRIRAH